LFDAEGLAGEHLAQIDFLPIEADAATGRDRDGFVVERIFEVWQAAIRLAVPMSFPNSSPLASLASP
jgi:hypothetical protein